MTEFLASCEIIDTEHPYVIRRGQELRAKNAMLTAINCFDFVRDRIPHCRDIATSLTPLCASETLRDRTGFCYAKSHLLAALLRVNRIPSGLGYMRLTDPKNESGYSLHCFNTIYLEPFGWVKADCRGNNDQVKTQFDPPGESLAHYPDLYRGEYFLPGNYATALPSVVGAYRKSRDLDYLRRHLPDDL